MTESYRDKLNEIDHKCLDEDLKFYDLRSLFESVALKLSAEDKEEIKKVIQNTNDAETIAAVLQAKAMDEKNESLEESFYVHDQSLVDDWVEQDLTFDIEQDGVYSFINASESREALKTAISHGYKDAWRETNKVYIFGDKVNESLEEKLIDAPQEVVDELINILNKYGFVLDDSFKVNPGKTFMGAVHLQVINPESIIEDSDEIDVQDELQKYVTRELIDDIHELDRESNCPITWNFGPNENGQVTGGLDIMKQYVEESYKDVYYVIVDKHGNQLSRPTKDDSELWDRVESRDPKGTRGLKVVVYTGKVDEKLSEASYGGAYDIEDDMFFTKDDLNEFLNILIDKLDNYFGYSFDVYDAYLSDPTHFYIELIDENHDINISYDFKIDMRRIRKPSDLQRYIPQVFEYFVKEYQNEYDEYNFDESLDEDTIKQNGKWVNKGKEGTHGKFATKKAADAQRKAMFANGYNESLNENYSAGYVKATPYNQDMIYSVSVNPAQKNGKGERYSIVTLHLVCGKDYVDSTAYDGQAWVDAKQFVDDVQLEQIVWYPDDESLTDALEANDYIECNRPHFIWHYDEEKDDWYRNTYIESLSEDYQQEKDEWGEPYSYDEVERELKSITNDWTDKEGTIRCYWEQEKNYGLQILKKHYKYVETSDGRTGKGEDMSWVLAYSKPKEIFDESLNESVTSQLQDKIIDCLDWFILMEMEFPKDKFLADSWEDVKDGIQMGIDSEFEVAEGIVEYLKPIITFNKRYNKEVEEEGVFQDEIEMYQSLVRAMNNYLAKNGYEERIEE